MQTSHSYATYKSPLGELVLTCIDEGISGIYSPQHKLYDTAKSGKHNPKPFQTALKQLDEYFAGKRLNFDVLLAPVGTEFQKSVWKTLKTIKFGKTLNYGAVANILENPKASRAVGLAISKNPIGIIVPCHRVIGANGKLTGFAGGLEAKKWLLDFESKQLL